jgi:hypothetical protein
LEKCEYLERIDFAWCVGLKMDGFKAISKCSKLKSISFNYEIGDDVFKYISKCSNIIYLNLSYCSKLTNKSLNYISNIKGLKKIILHQCKFKHDDLILLSKCKNLECLDISLNSFSNDTLLHLSKNCNKLKDILIGSWDTPKLTIIGLKYLIKYCKNLEYVYLGYNTNLAVIFNQFLKKNNINIVVDLENLAPSSFK